MPYDLIHDHIVLLHIHRVIFEGFQKYALSGHQMNKIVFKSNDIGYSEVSEFLTKRR